MKKTHQGIALPLRKWENEYWEPPIQFKPIVPAKGWGAILMAWFRRKLRRGDPPARCDPQPSHLKGRGNARRLAGGLWVLPKAATGGIP